MKQIPMEEFFKVRHEPIYILESNFRYEDFFRKYNLRYETWNEDGLGKLVGAVIELGEFEYFLISPYDYSEANAFLAFYVKAGCSNPKQATNNLISMLELTDNEIEEISEHYLKYRWQMIRVPKDGPETVIVNFEDLSVAENALEFSQKKHIDRFYLRKI